MVDTPPLSAPNPTAALVPALMGGSAVYLSGEDALKVTVFNALTSVVVRLTGRFLPVDSARVQVFARDLTPTTDRAASTLILPLGEGWLLDAGLIVSTGAPQVGQTFGVVSVQRGVGGAALELATLVQGYLTQHMRRAWPAAPLASSLDGPGALRSITGTDPAAGVEIAETVPLRARWRVIALQATYVAGIAVANRSPRLIYDDGATAFCTSPTESPIVASETRLCVSSDASAVVVALDGIGAWWMPGQHRLSASARIRTVTTNLQAADNWSAPQLLVEEWIEV